MPPIKQDKKATHQKSRVCQCYFCLESREKAEASNDSPFPVTFTALHYNQSPFLLVSGSIEIIFSVDCG